MAPDEFPPTTHRFVDLPGLRMHLAEAGEGPLVVLLHGFPDFWYSWRRQIGPLAAAGHRVVAPDMRGYNLSDKPSGLTAYRLPHSDPLWQRAAPIGRPDQDEIRTIAVPGAVVPFLHEGTLFARWDYASGRQALRALVAIDARSNWFEGAMLLAVFFILAIGFFFIPEGI